MLCVSSRPLLLDQDFQLLTASNAFLGLVLSGSLQLLLHVEWSSLKVLEFFLTSTILLIVVNLAVLQHALFG